MATDAEFNYFAAMRNPGNKASLLPGGSPGAFSQSSSHNNRTHIDRDNEDHELVYYRRAWQNYRRHQKFDQLTTNERNKRKQDKNSKILNSQIISKTSEMLSIGVNIVTALKELWDHKHEGQEPVR